MPDWRMHLKSAKNLDMKFKMAGVSDFTIGNMEDFNIGVILPDTPWLSYSGQVREEDLKYKLHYYNPRVGSSCIIPNYFKFLADKKQFIANTDVGKGMLLHLILDAVVNGKFNESIVESDTDYFEVMLIDGTNKRISGVNDKVRLIDADIHGYEDIISFDYINDMRVSTSVRDYLRDLGCSIPMVDLVIKINEHNEKSYYASSRIFTVMQYEQMIEDSIQLLCGLAKVEGWK